MLYFVTGIPASGKTTYCKDKNSINFDEWVINFTKHTVIEKATTEFNKNFLENMSAFADEVRKQYHDTLYIDCCALQAKERSAFVQHLKYLGIESISCIYILCPLYQAIKRNDSRENPLSKETIYRCFTQQEYPTTAEGFSNVNFITRY